MPSTINIEDLDKLHIGRGEPRRDLPRGSGRTYVAVAVGVTMLIAAVSVAFRGRGGVPLVDVVRASALSPGAADVVLSAAGYIAAHHTIHVNSKVTGRLAWVGVEAGDHVALGAVLVRLEDQEFRAQVEQAQGAVASALAHLRDLEQGPRPEETRQALHNLDEARAHLVNDAAALERSQRLFARGLLAKHDLDTAVAQHRATEQRAESLSQAYALTAAGRRPQEIEQARGALGQATGQLAFAESQLQATVIRAPIAGTILERTAEKGELVTAQFASGAAGGPRGSVVTIADLDDLRVEVEISQNDFARTRPHQPAIVVADAYPDREYQAVISQVSPQANRQNATIEVKVSILHPDGFLRPDMNATVRFVADAAHATAAAPAGVLVPARAVRDRDGTPNVWVIQDGTVRQRSIRILSPRADGDLVEGVAQGEELIVDAAQTIKPGDRVAVRSPSGQD